LPPGPKVVLTGGLDFNDHRVIWDRLDQVHALHPDMVLVHGGSPRGAELIAAKWAAKRNVPQIAFKPDWAKHAKAAPFRRNDAMLTVMPIGVIVFPGHPPSMATLPTRRGNSASPFGGSTAARKRRITVGDEPHHQGRSLDSLNLAAATTSPESFRVVPSTLLRHKRLQSLCSRRVSPF
jgi:hypothetical protein